MTEIDNTSWWDEAQPGRGLARLTEQAMQDPKLAKLLLEQHRRTVRGSMLAWSQEALSSQDQAPARHHQLIISRLEKVVSGEIDRLMILAPPGSAKSTYATILFPPYWLVRCPQTAIISASHTAGLADSFGRKVRNAVMANGQTLGYSLAGDSRAANKWTTDRGGEYITAGVGMAIAGRRADLVVIDDPMKGREDAENAGARDRVWNWYTADIYGRIKPRARIVVIMTRWHEDDLGGRLLQEMGDGGDKWDVLKLPAICEQEEGDPLGRKVGEALWPEWEDEAAIARKRRVAGEREYVSQYQQRPAPSDGIIFDSTKIGTIQSVSEQQVVARVRGWDLAGTDEAGGRDPDWTVGVRMAKLEDGRVVVEDVVRFRGSSREVEDRMVQTAELDGHDVPISFAQDPGQAGKSQVAYLASKLAGYVVHTSVETGKKETRAMPLASQVEAGNVSTLDRIWRKRLIEEIAVFPFGSKDDQVDALSRSFTYLVGSGATSAEAMIEYYRGLGRKRTDPRAPRSGNELLDVYNKRLDSLTQTDVRMCARCKQEIGERETTVTDGVDHWHSRCVGGRG